MEFEKKIQHNTKPGHAVMKLWGNPWFQAL